MLRTRIYTVLVLLPLFLAALFLSSAAVWALLLAPLLLVAAWEWGALAGWSRPVRGLFLLGIGACALGLWFHGARRIASGFDVWMVVFILSALFWLMVAPLWLARAWRVRSALLLAPVGVLLLLPLWAAMVRLHDRPVLLLVMMTVVWVSDTAAYFAGHRWGRRKLAPEISPGKTWEGVFGALAAVGVYFVLISCSGVTQQALPPGVVGGAWFVFLAGLGIEGDLFESWIKRTAGVKDSGSILPGHGGLLDRVDALTASLPAAALVLGFGL